MAGEVRQSTTPISIVIPVYGNWELLARLLNKLDEVLQNSQQPEWLTEILLVNDKPDDVGTAEFLEGLLSSSKLPLRLLVNEKNLGFVHSVNRGFASADTNNHILILNTDTIPYRGFFDRLNQIVERLDAIGNRWASLTPVSNSATIATVPEMCEEYSDYPRLAQAEQIATLCFSLFQEPSDLLQIPVGIGFCMLFSRRALDEIGQFDIAFSPGYGEEVDWCLRAADHAYKHYLTPGIFVHHDGGASFSEARKGLMDSHHRMILARYPAYEKSIQGFLERGENRRFHDILRPFINFLSALHYPRVAVQLNHGNILRNVGGTEKYVLETNRYLFQNHKVSAVCLAPVMVGDFQFVSCIVDGKSVTSLSVDSFCFLLSVLLENGLISIESFTLQHSLNWLAPDLDRILEFFAPWAPVRNVIAHDFFFLCPQVNLLYNEEVFCGAPPREDSYLCSTCQFGENLVRHRERSRQLLSYFTRIVCPSESTRNLFQKVLGNIPTPVEVRPHLIMSPRKSKSEIDVSRARKIRLMYLGGAVKSKGRVRFESLVSKFGKKFEWITVGTVGFLPKATGTTHLCYNFQRGDSLLELASGFDPCYVILASIWPETFSYTLHEAISLGYPILTTSESGNIADVVRSENIGMVFDTEQDLYDYLEKAEEALFAEHARFEIDYDIRLNESGIEEVYLSSGRSFQPLLPQFNVEL